MPVWRGFACSVRVGMQKEALLCTPCVCEQYQIAVFHLKSTGETSQDAQTAFLTWVFHLEKYHGSWRSLQEMLADSSGRRAMVKKR